MFSASDTIVAIATPPGRGGIGVVRVSGADALAVVRRLLPVARELEPRRATLTTIVAVSESAAGGDGRGGARVGVVGDAVGPGSADALDEAVVTYFPSPHSYTGEDVVEISAHGSPVVLRAIVEQAMAAGARLAEPGEFTLRAFLGGRIDLAQAEAVADLIDAVTPLQARAAFDQLQGTLTGTIAEIDSALFDLIARLEASVDFPEEGYHFVDRRALATALDELVARTGDLVARGRAGRLVREGLQIAIVGRPNVGKSSVFNALVGASRAIVSDVPGTTRDLVTETVEIGGLRVLLADTAGMRESGDAIEAEGVARARGASNVSDLILLVVDGSEPLTEPDRELFSQVVDKKHLILINKIDKIAAWPHDRLGFWGGDVRGAVRMSAVSGAGLDVLRASVVRALDVEPLADAPAITNVRHIALVRRAHESCVRARAAVMAGETGMPEEFVLADLQLARAALEEITGRRTSDDLLAHIFARFCLGK